ncbi:amidohydrolase family protein, partial [uncultured Duncaniella sp.]|uniref:amidohydrolase family protein n=1 Tax=uncultured Duncaniella sp. TaxID=2768039 RepID=UPI0026EFDFEE
MATGTGAPGFRATETFDAGGAMLFPGLIDSHVHFREPGLEQKATIASESRAALAGGITSYLEMPNTKPPTLTADALADKYLRAAARSAANYGFFLGATATTASELMLVPRHRLPALKLFMGATTGAVSTPPPAALEEIFRICSAEDIVVMVHAEDDAIIAAEAAKAIIRFGSRENVPVGMHRTIRSREACVTASSRAVELATRHNTRLHIAHV